MTSTTLRRALLPVALVASLGLAACGSGDPLAETEPGSAGGAATGDASPDPAASGGAAGGSGSITVGGANFTEMQVMEEMYGALLTDAGYEVEIVASDSREIYGQALVDGDIDVVPEYAATMAEFLNREVNGAEAPVVATGDVTETVEALRGLAEQQGLVVAEPAEASSQNGFAVLESVASENDVATLTDFAAVQPEIVLAATEECPTRPFCQIGLEETYGFTVSSLLPLGYGSPQAKQAVVAGEADMVLVGTTDATLEADGLVLLEDDQALQLADNLVPVLNATSAEDTTLVETLDSLADVLTTEDLAELNRRVDADRELPADVARDYLVEQGLIEG
ncbi:glycine betaine ABC transporter substrate-binding protein [Aquipuribacter hungaricus]|uniref:Glycine betaine ABC transporter substrate-binding protein n=1 Tax=Aquipuribacter hungaricus TaxID=545624 RepID=A0ABV7WK98_9MICO